MEKVRTKAAIKQQKYQNKINANFMNNKRPPGLSWIFLPQKCQK